MLYCAWSVRSQWRRGFLITAAPFLNALYNLSMETNLDRWHKRWLDLAGRVKVLLADAGLEGLAEAFSMALHPLGVLAVNVLWIAEPMFGEPVSALAGLLDDEAKEENPRVDNCH